MELIAIGAHVGMHIPGATRTTDTAEGGCGKTTVGAFEGCSASVCVTAETLQHRQYKDLASHRIGES